eukprot:1150497-Pelagomonas_calceolata.AAC.6
MRTAVVWHWQGTKAGTMFARVHHPCVANKLRTGVPRITDTLCTVPVLRGQQLPGKELKHKPRMWCAHFTLTGAPRIDVGAGRDRELDPGGTGIAAWVTAMHGGPIRAVQGASLTIGCLGGEGRKERKGTERKGKERER